MADEVRMVPKVHLREEVADFARWMELQMRGKDPVVRSGDWKHWKQMLLSDLLQRLRRNTDELHEMVTAGEEPSRATRKAADLANIANFIALRIARGDRLEPEG